MDPFLGSVLGMGLNLGGNIAGGLIGRSGSKSIGKANRNFQREVLMNQIKWRVQDAKDAGIHPLYALGSPGISTGPMQIHGDPLGGALQEAGQDLGRSVERGLSHMLRENRAMERRLMVATEKKDLAQAGYYDALKRQVEGTAGRTNIIEEPSFGQWDALGGAWKPSAPQGKYEVIPSEKTSPKKGFPELSAGPPDPSLQEVWLQAGVPMMVPKTSGEAWQEVWSEMNVFDKLAVIGHNVRRFGIKWYWDIMRYFGGMEPKHRYLPSSRQFRKSEKMPEDFKRFMEGAKEWVLPFD